MDSFLEQLNIGLGMPPKKRRKRTSSEIVQMKKLGGVYTLDFVDAILDAQIAALKKMGMFHAAMGRSAALAHSMMRYPIAKSVDPLGAMMSSIGRRFDFTGKLTPQKIPFYKGTPLTPRQEVMTSLFPLATMEDATEWNKERNAQEESRKATEKESIKESKAQKGRLSSLRLKNLRALTKDTSESNIPYFMALYGDDWEEAMHHVQSINTQRNKENEDKKKQKERASYEKWWQNTLDEADAAELAKEEEAKQKRISGRKAFRHAMLDDYEQYLRETGEKFGGGRIGRERARRVYERGIYKEYKWLAPIGKAFPAVGKSLPIIAQALKATRGVPFLGAAVKHPLVASAGVAMGAMSIIDSAHAKETGWETSGFAYGDPSQRFREAMGEAGVKSEDEIRRRWAQIVSFGSQMRYSGKPHRQLALASKWGFDLQRIAQKIDLTPDELMSEIGKQLPGKEKWQIAGLIQELGGLVDAESIQAAAIMSGKPASYSQKITGARTQIETETAKDLATGTLGEKIAAIPYATPGVNIPLKWLKARQRAREGNGFSSQVESSDIYSTDFDILTLPLQEASRKMDEAAKKIEEIQNFQLPALSPDFETKPSEEGKEGGNTITISLNDVEIKADNPRELLAGIEAAVGDAATIRLGLLDSRDTQRV